MVALAVERNERARVADAQAEAAGGRVQRARAFFFPELLVTGSYTRRLHETVRNVGGGSGDHLAPRRPGGAGQPGGAAVRRRGCSRSTARPSWRTSRPSCRPRQERRLLGYEAADAFLMVLSQQQVLSRPPRGGWSSRATTLKDARARAAAGLVSSNDVTRGELEAATAERELSTANASSADRAPGARLPGRQPSWRAATLATPDGLLAEAGRQADGRRCSSWPPGSKRRLDLQAGRRRGCWRCRRRRQEPMLRALPGLAGVAQYRVTNEQGFAGRVGDGFAGRRPPPGRCSTAASATAERTERQALARAGAGGAGRPRAGGGPGRAPGAGDAGERPGHPEGRGRGARRSPAGTCRRPPSCTARGWCGALEVADANLRLFEAEVALARERYALALAYLDLRAAAGEDPPGAAPDVDRPLSEREPRELLRADSAWPPWPCCWLRPCPRRLQQSGGRPGGRRPARRRRSGGRGPAGPGASRRSSRSRSQPVAARAVEYTVTAVGSVEAFERVQVTARVPAWSSGCASARAQTVGAGRGAGRDRAGALPAGGRVGARRRSRRPGPPRPTPRPGVARREKAVAATPGPDPRRGDRDLAHPAAHRRRPTWPRSRRRWPRPS